MGFGSDLKYSHDALLKLQDWELRLLETVKKFMVMRVKSDKEYASTLQNLCNQVDKESTCQLDYISNVSKVRLKNYEFGMPLALNVGFVCLFCLSWILLDSSSWELMFLQCLKLTPFSSLLDCGAVELQSCFQFSK